MYGRPIRVATQVGMFVAAIAAAGPLCAGAQTANPVVIVESSGIQDKVRSVTCSGGSLGLGTWLRVFGTTVTSQEALINQVPEPTHLDKNADIRPSILYCFGPDGRPGEIVDPPKALLLPVGTRVTVGASLNVLFGQDEHAKIGAGFTIPANGGMMHVDKRGSVFSDGYSIWIVPRDVVVTMGNGYSVLYERPGAFNRLVPSSTCTIQYFDSHGTRAHQGTRDTSCAVLMDSEFSTLQR